MNKILILVVLFLCTNVFAEGVLDSETTDNESETQCCPSEENNVCASATPHQPSAYSFNPTKLTGVFQFHRNWYVINNKIQFIPVSR